MKHNDDYESDEFDDIEVNDDDYRGGVLRWLSIAFVAAAGAGFLALAWYAYKSGMEPVSEDEIPYVAADTDPFKEKPADPGGLQFEHQDKTVYNQLATGNGNQQMAERLLPPPEEPVERVIAEPVNPEEFQKEPVEAIGNSAEESPADVQEKAAVEQVESVPLATIPEVQTEKVTVVPSTKSETDTMVVIEPQRTEEQPPVTAKPADVKTGQFMAQLGAFSSEEEAKAAWEKVNTAHGSMFSTKNHVLQRADVSGKTFHRLQIGPFESEAAARKTCEYLQGHKQACFIVSVK